MVTEISLIGPPIGMNVFVLRHVLPDVPSATIFKGVPPFVLCGLGCLALLVLVPGISVPLPSLM